MSTPFGYSRRLRTYSEQVREWDRLIDDQRRARNRLLVAVIVLAAAAVAGYLWGSI